MSSGIVSSTGPPAVRSYDSGVAGPFASRWEADRHAYRLRQYGYCTRTVYCYGDWYVKYWM